MLNSLDLMMEIASNYVWDQGYIHHFVFGMGLGVPLLFAYFWHIRKQRQFLFVMLSLPILIELTQYFIPTRSCDFFDVLSTWLGTLLIFWAARERRILRRKEV